MKSINFYRIFTVLFFFLSGTCIGLWYGFKSGQNYVNHWLVVSAWNDAYMTGKIDGNTQTLYLIYEEYIKNHPYKLEDYPEMPLELEE